MENTGLSFDPVRLSDYTYDLPDDRIARYPVTPRDSSKLLVYKDGAIQHDQFCELQKYLPADSLLVFNDTKVLPARMYFQKPTGATIELLFLHPELPTRLINDAMLVTGPCTWACMIGNKKRWKETEVLTRTLDLEGETITLQAAYSSYEHNHVQISWTGERPFLEVLQALGEMPLPPYLGRATEDRDLETYQTVYARQEGAVAAPTAGLHFTEEVLSRLEDKGIERAFLTLHVGAGTFLPIKVETIAEHQMHSEQVVYTRPLIEHLLRKIDCIVPVGTTSLRSLESLYWYGVKLVRQESTAFQIEKLYPYRSFDSELPSPTEALQAILDRMDAGKVAEITGDTEIFIFPGYHFRLCRGLITNYHQPGSTLVLLVAAFVGNAWKTIYQTALAQGYRFLSYGDSSLLWRD